MVGRDILNGFVNSGLTEEFDGGGFKFKGNGMFDNKFAKGLTGGGVGTER